jgi:oxygen-independent coproporphyrinogen-3 oxidase
MPSVTAHGPSPSSSPPAGPSVNPDAAGFGVYIHWPFCASKCPYCDFNSHVRAGGIDQARYLAAFRRELAYVRDTIGPRRVGSIFIGGGTPSLAEVSTIAGLLEGIARLWVIEGDAEITLEANPSSVEADRFSGYRSAGVNRVSLGLQALRDGDLRRLGRLHTVAEGKSAVKIAARMFSRSSFDLIYARPEQTLASWRDELSEALDMAAGHVSLYQLTIEEGTPFAALHAGGKLAVPDGDLATEFYELTGALTSARGLRAYEVSNYAAPGEESRHNLLYWRYGEYGGIGPGAHGRIIAAGERLATTTERLPERWLERVETAGHGFTTATALSRSEQADEALLMGLRIDEGVDLDRLAGIGGVTPAKAALDDLVGLGLLTTNGDHRLRTTTRGRMVLNEIVARLSAAFEVAMEGNPRNRDVVTGGQR